MTVTSELPEGAVAVRSERSMIVSEIFGPTIQGEGPSCGQRASFVRLGLCNLDCAWCDTPYTWDWTGKNGAPQDRGALIDMSVAEVGVRVRQIDARLVVVTGGEPMLQQRRIAELAERITDEGYRIEIETNGTIAPKVDMDVRYNVSPKLASSGVDPRHAQDAMDKFGGVAGSIFKFVIMGRRDLDALDALLEDRGIAPWRVWLMPEGRTAFDLSMTSTSLAEAAIEREYNFSTRLHVMLWDDERGR